MKSRVKCLYESRIIFKNRGGRFGKKELEILNIVEIIIWFHVLLCVIWPEFV